MKMMRQLPWLLLSCALLPLAVNAQDDEVNSESLARSAGFWKTDTGNSRRPRAAVVRMASLCSRTGRRRPLGGAGRPRVERDTIGRLAVLRRTW